MSGLVSGRDTENGDGQGTEKAGSREDGKGNRVATELSWKACYATQSLVRLDCFMLESNK